MSRKDSSNDIRTRFKGVKVGKRVVVNGEPQALVGPESNKDLFSLQDMTETLYGEGYKCVVLPPTTTN
nr:hypothetical protein [Clostridia bacterium]